TLKGSVDVGGFVLTVQGAGVAAFEGPISGTHRLEFRGSKAYLRANNPFSGLTQVFAPGALLVTTGINAGGTLGGTIEVEDGATLGGRGGILGEVVVKSNGTFSPGESPGVLTVTQGI